MVLITIKPSLARLLISARESDRRYETYQYLENEIREGRWDNIPPIWLTPNFLLNGLFCGSLELHPTIKPLIVYNGHHRLEKALEHNFLVRAYIRYTPGNPTMPLNERLHADIPY
ncbi:MAG: hypothetical protein WC796_04860 [Candidatus Pacearchaeota archaeon]|jgi:hypothetical protein